VGALAVQRKVQIFCGSLLPWRGGWCNAGLTFTAAGGNVKAVQRMLGHASASMTLDVYAGLFGDDLDDIAHRLDEAVTARRADHSRTSTDDGAVVDLGKRRSPGR
jgi:hypothetical protein